MTERAMLVTIAVFLLLLSRVDARRCQHEECGSGGCCGDICCEDELEANNLQSEVGGTNVLLPPDDGQSQTDDQHHDDHYDDDFKTNSRSSTTESGMDDAEETKRQGRKEEVKLIGVFIFSGFLMLAIAIVASVCVLKHKQAPKTRVQADNRIPTVMDIEPVRPPSYETTVIKNRSLPPLNTTWSRQMEPLQVPKGSMLTPLPPINHGDRAAHAYYPQPLPPIDHAESTLGARYLEPLSQINHGQPNISPRYLQPLPPINHGEPTTIDVRYLGSSS